MLDSRITRENAIRILNWCYEMLGPSRFNKSKPKLIFHKNDHCSIEHAKPEVYGKYQWWTNTINLYGQVYNLKGGDNLLMFIDVIIHEYWHYKQNCRKMFTVYFSRYGYNEDNHPYEKTAIKKAQKMRQQCYDELFA